jgi:AcrR family transcriptional regulator
MLTYSPEAEEVRIVSGASSADHRKGPRRRGNALYSAIFEATLDELTEVGYAELRMERIAGRARASKGSLYRRWSSRAELVADAIHYAYPTKEEPPDTGSVREDLLGNLRAFADLLNGPSGEAIRGLMAETIRNPDLMDAIRLRLIEPGVSGFLDILRRGVVRGEVRASALTLRTASVGPDLLRQHFLVYRSIPDGVLSEIVDEVIMPLIRT